MPWKVPAKSENFCSSLGYQKKGFDLNSVVYLPLLFSTTLCMLNSACTPKKNDEKSAAKSSDGDAVAAKDSPTEEEKEKMARGLAYPYERSPHSFLLVGGENYRMTTFSVDAFGDSKISDGGTEMSVTSFLAKKGLSKALEGRRTAVIGYGSNAAPSALISKFSPPKYEKTPVIPVIKATITDFDVVYSAAVGYYGTLQAALFHSPGAKVEVFITYLNDDELKRMHDSEGVGKYYDVGTLRKGPSAQELIIDEFGARVDSIRLYSDLTGAYNFDGKAVAFKKVNGVHTLPAKEHPEVIDHILTKSVGSLGKGLGTMDYILMNLRWNDAAQEMSRLVRANCIPITLPNYEVEQGAFPETEVCGKGKAKP